MAMTAPGPLRLACWLALVVALVVPPPAAGDAGRVASCPHRAQQGGGTEGDAKACRGAGVEPDDDRSEADAGPAGPEAREGQEQDDGDEEAGGNEVEGVTGDLLVPGSTILGSVASRGLAQEINGSADIDVNTVALRWSRVFGSPGERFLGAYPAIGIELIPAMTFEQEPTAWAAGFHVMYEHRFVSRGIMPVLRLGAGFLYGNDEVPPGETRHNFSLLAGLGVDIPVGGAAALGLEYRLHHVSNAGTGDVNPGINAHTGAVSLSFYF